MNEPSIWVTTALLAVLFFVKMYILSQATNHTSARRWFYFTLPEIVEAPICLIAKLRKLQNRLTVLFFIVAALSLLFLFLFGK